MPGIGYMGIPFSNSEEAASLLAKKCNLTDQELIPLMSSSNVIDSLLNRTVEYGVVAVKNAVAGPVIETENALAGKPLDIIGTIDIPIHHCLFVKDIDATIDTVSSHVQALLQCQRNLEALCPGCERIEMEDTAYAAEMLANGEYPINTAVVCRKDAGNHYGLILKAENIEDDKNNITTFSLLKVEFKP